MKKFQLLIVISAALLLANSGCATLDTWKDSINQNPLRNLNAKQSNWFDRTSEGWRFE